MSRSHPSWEDILESVEAGSDAADPVHQHCRDCSDCADVEHRIHRLVLGLEMASIAPPRRELVDSILRRIATERARTGRSTAAAISDALARLKARLAAGVEETIATLVADSLTPAHAVRGAATFAAPRMMVFETDAFTISISLSPGDEDTTLDVQGQVMPKQSATLPPGGVAIVGQADRSWSASLSEFGEFTMRGVAVGTFQIHIDLGESLLRLGPVAGESGF